MTATEVAAGTCGPIKCSLTVDELDALVDKVVKALPNVLEDEWLGALEDMINFPPIAEEDEESFRHAFWQAVRVTIEGLAKYGLIAEPLIASIEIITGADRATIAACSDPARQCLLRAVGELTGCHGKRPDKESAL